MLFPMQATRMGEVVLPAANGLIANESRILA